MAVECIQVVVDLEGILQGVGFRPTLQRMATSAGLDGWVQNRSGRVRLALGGPASSIRCFLRQLPQRLPPHARLDEISIVERSIVSPDTSGSGFRILDSSFDERQRICIPSDLAMCPDCREEVLDPGSRFYGYPFTTCTSCGPRYTVVEGMPYDRNRTSLSVFPLCPRCKRDYENPTARRFHAESIACPVCGPRLALLDGTGRPVTGDPLRLARRAIADGAIVAVRGLGGFLLAVDGFNREALVTLRKRKRRPHKPFAAMAANIDVLEGFCRVPAAARQLLRGPEAPIVILDVWNTSNGRRSLPIDLLTPDGLTLGAMLPTTPLHLLLLEPLGSDSTPAFDLLVMTSGNRRAEPICTRNDEALERLHGIADFFLTHDREIRFRNDDSLCILADGRPQVWRRSRGYAPNAFQLARPLRRCVLAMGAELKNTIALGFGHEVVISPHIGDLETPEARDELRRIVNEYPLYYGQSPQVIAVDLHPDMYSSRLGRRLAAEHDLPVIEVQHHHAHAASVMAEHGVDEALAVVFDGMGLGLDGTFWGAELLHVTPGGFQRLATFEGSPLPGGDTAVHHPVRQLIARWIGFGSPVTSQWCERLGLEETELEVIALQCQRGVNAPVSHAAGRLFDAFAVLLGVAPKEVSYEGQAAIRLEALAKRHIKGTPLPEAEFGVEIRGRMMVVKWSPLFERLRQDPPAEGSGVAWAAAFHRAIANAALRMTEHAREVSECGKVVLSGGVFQNRILTGLLVPALHQAGFQVLPHRQVPPNDGGVSLGQAWIAGGIG